MQRRTISKVIKIAAPALPLAGAVASVFFPLRTAANQFVLLAVLVWLQVYMIFEILMAGK